jgi:23S rRNA (pseudouridine1915-N3)-methyltransferase
VIRILCIGRVKSAYLREGIEDYLARARRFARIEVIELPDQDRARESRALLAALGPARCLLCDRSGEPLTSEQLAAELGAHGSVDFLLGGPDGVDSTLRLRVDRRIGFGAITLPHELARLILCEQIYRGFCILRGHPYHRGSIDR